MLESKFRAALSNLAKSEEKIEKLQVELKNFTKEKSSIGNRQTTHANDKRSEVHKVADLMLDDHDSDSKATCNDDLRSVSKEKSNQQLLSTNAEQSNNTDLHVSDTENTRSKHTDIERTETPGSDTNTKVKDVPRNQSTPVSSRRSRMKSRKSTVSSPATVAKPIKSSQRDAHERNWNTTPHSISRRKTKSIMKSNAQVPSAPTKTAFASHQPKSSRSYGRKTTTNTKDYSKQENVDVFAYEF